MNHSTTPDVDMQKESIYAFLQKEGEMREREWVIEKLEGPTTNQHPNLGLLCVYKGVLGEFWVSTRNNVVNFSAPEAMSVKEAQAYVSEFLARHIEDFHDRNFIQEDAERSDRLWKESWIEEPTDDEISIFENWVNIQVNLDTRQIHYQNRSDLRHVRTTSPALDEAAARQAILSKNAHATIEELDLLEHTVDGGKTWVTVWNAVIVPGGDPESPRKLYSINADTGKVVP